MTAVARFNCESCGWVDVPNEMTIIQFYVYHNKVHRILGKPPILQEETQ